MPPDRPLREGAWPLLAPSALPYTAKSQIPREMTREDMQRVREEFVSAARRADTAGFDLLLLHMAHGYLLASFLSPLSNQRTDEYGGALENRLRFPLEVFDAVRAIWPREKPLGVVLNADDCAPGGYTIEDAVAVARILKEHGCDLIQPLAGQTVPDGAPSLRPRLPDALQRPHPQRGRHTHARRRLPDHDERGQHDPRGGSRRPVHPLASQSHRARDP